MKTTMHPAASRREFLRSGTVGFASALVAARVRGGTPAAPAQAPATTRGAVEEVHVAAVGCGRQMECLFNASFAIPGVRYEAICDIWPYNLRATRGRMQRLGHSPSAHADFGEFLSAASDRGVQAVIVATPDVWHSPFTVAALRAGFHVYCEKMMSNTVEGARAMVRAMKETGRLCQIGHQRRSNPEYRYAKERLLADPGVLGRIVNATAQWNRSVVNSAPIVCADRIRLDPAVLEKHGYASMEQFLNWRLFRKYGGGPVSDLGAHQIDIFSWLLGTRPASVVASGGVDYFRDREWYDNVMAIYEYAGPAGRARAYYQVLTTTSAGGGYSETFMGDLGTLRVSEMPGVTCVYREPHVEAKDWAGRRLLIPRAEEDLIPGTIDTIALLDLRASRNQSAHDLPVRLTVPPHRPHLENFFAAVRGGAGLNCPADEAFASEAAVFKVNESVAAGRKLEFTPADFEA